MTECESDMPTEHVLSLEDAVSSHSLSSIYIYIKLI